MLPEITFSDGNKVVVTSGDVECIVNNIKTRWAQRVKRPPTTLAYYDIDAIISNAVLTYLENKAKALARKTDYKSLFYLKEMARKGFINNVLSTINVRLLNNIVV